MHIPDGFLTVNTWLPAWIVSLGGLGVCLKKVSAMLKDKMVPLMGVMAAFIFAAQMLNFPVMGGTSGHLLGGVLAAVLLGPYAGAIVIAVVLAVQCLIFQDGGLTSLGANIFDTNWPTTPTDNIVIAIARRAKFAKRVDPIGEIAVCQEGGLVQHNGISNKYHFFRGHNDPGGP